MSEYTVTVIKTGNSYALRVPKAYVVDGGLTLGQKVEVSLPKKRSGAYHQQDRVAFEQAFQELQKSNPFRDIEDPVAWQREIRKDRPLPGRD